MTKKKSRRTGVRMGKEQASRNSSFSKRRRTGHGEGMKHTEGKKTSKKRQNELGTGKQSQDYMSETGE